MDPQRLLGPIKTRSFLIDSYDTFILDNIPYGEVRPRTVQWGALQYDGPDAPGMAHSKPAMQWHFGGVAYPITRAVRVPYTFVRTWDGSNDIVTQSVFLGFQDNIDQYIAPQPVPFVANPSSTFLARATGSAFGPFGAVSNEAWSSDAAVLASESVAVVTRSYSNSAIGPATFDAFIRGELGITAEQVATMRATPAPVDFDGPAQDNDSHNVFQYTAATLFNDPEKYAQVLFWYFAGKPYRVTKAMRIPLTPTSGSTVVAQSVRFKATLGPAPDTSAAATQKEAAERYAAAKAAFTEGATQGKALFIGFAGGSDPGG